MSLSHAVVIALAALFQRRFLEKQQAATGGRGEMRRDEVKGRGEGADV